MLEIFHNPAPADFDATVVDIRMRPNVIRHLRHNALLLGGIAVACLTVGGIFFIAGATPVLGFMGAEVVLLYAAFRFGYNLARRRERVTLTGSALRIERRDHKGRATDVTLEPYWLRFDVHEIPGRVARLFAVAKGRREEIGYFLGPEERLEVAATLKSALAELKANPSG